VAKEWDDERNGKLLPSQVTAMSGRRVHWVCKHGHRWYAVVSNRTGGHAGCPECQLRPESRQEIYLRHELAHVFGFSAEPHKVRCGRKLYSCDIVCHEDMMVIEFDGSWWHRATLAKDQEKSRALQDAGWRVIRVRELPLCHIGPEDVSVAQSLSPKQRADVVVAHIADLLGRGDVAGYVSQGTLQNKTAADAYIAEKLACKAEARAARLQGRRPSPDSALADS